MGFVEIGSRKTSPDGCWWYHSLDFPDGSKVEGHWDLRGRFSDYVGGVDVAGRRVLDVGTASGFLAFSAEQAGAREVVAFDMPINGNWDTVPIANIPIAGLDASEVDLRLRGRRLSEATRYRRADQLGPMREGFFYAHHKFASKVRLYEAGVYEIDDKVGVFDVAFLGAILLHLRDPFLALHKVAQITTDEIVIADLSEKGFREMAAHKPYLEFLPFAATENLHAWWRLSRGALDQMLNVVGFKIKSESLNNFKFRGIDHSMLTLVAKRVAV